MYTRRKIPGIEVKETVKRGSSRILPTVNTIWDGLHIVCDGVSEYHASRSILHDGGGMGVGLTFIESPMQKREDVS